MVLEYEFVELCVHTGGLVLRPFETFYASVVDLPSLLLIIIHSFPYMGKTVVFFNTDIILAR